jgi:hypothetical protein
MQAGPGIAISADGTTAVSYSTWEKEHTLVVDLLSHGRIVGVQEIPIAFAEIPISAEVLAASGGSFRAEWELRKTLEGLVGIETAEVSSGGLLSPGVFVPWPYKSNAPRVSDGIFRSDARGDEVAIWPAKELQFREGVTPAEWYLASRSAGGAWSSPQLIGTTGEEGANEIAVAIGLTGRFTVVWTSAESQQMVVGGAAGSQVSNPMPLQRRPTGLTERFQQLALTTTGRVVAVWSTDRGSKVSTSLEVATSVDGVHFSRPRRISPTKHHICGYLDKRLVADRAGGALVWWSCGNEGHQINEYARYRP